MAPQVVDPAREKLETRVKKLQSEQDWFFRNAQRPVAGIFLRKNPIANIVFGMRFIQLKMTEDSLSQHIAQRNDEDYPAT